MACVVAPSEVARSHPASSRAIARSATARVLAIPATPMSSARRVAPRLVAGEWVECGVLLALTVVGRQSCRSTPSTSPTATRWPGRSSHAIAAQTNHATPAQSSGCSTSSWARFGRVMVGRLSAGRGGQRRLPERASGRGACIFQVDGCQIGLPAFVEVIRARSHDSAICPPRTVELIAMGKAGVCRASTRSPTQRGRCSWRWQPREAVWGGRPRSPRTCYAFTSHALARPRARGPGRKVSAPFAREGPGIAHFWQRSRCGGSLLGMAPSCGALGGASRLP